VKSFIQDCSNGGNVQIFDPFAGSGTTCIVAGEERKTALGIDVSPLSIFIAQTKATKLSSAQLCKAEQVLRDLNELPHCTPTTPPANATVLKYFEPEALDAILKLKAFTSQVDDKSIANLFQLAMLSAIEPFSTHRKAGNGVKRKTNYVPQSDACSALIRFVENQISRYVSDIAETPDFVSPEFVQGSSLRVGNLTELDGISCVLTSPPYANCFDYSKIYMSELWLGDFFKSKSDQVKFRADSVRSHVHATWPARFEGFGSQVVDQFIAPYVDSQALWSNKIGAMLSGYFSDLAALLAELKPRIQKGGKVGFVVGNSFYGGVPVATDLLLADIALQLGYVVDEVRVYRGVIPSSQQYKRLAENRKYMRESLLVLRRI
jgi:hypothetical protein